MVIRRRLQPNYIPGQQLACCSEVEVGQVFQGCPKVVDINIATAGAAAGDYIALTVKSNCGYCSTSYPNLLNAYSNTWSSPLNFRFDIGDPANWSPEASIAKFEEVLNLDVRFNGFIALERLSPSSFRLTAREPWIQFEVIDASEGFSISSTVVRDSPSPTRIQYGHMVWLDDCGNAMYPSEDSPFFTGFVAHCQNRHEECGIKAICRNYYIPGEVIPVQMEGREALAIIVGNLPTAANDILAFDPNNAPGVAAVIPYGSNAPPGGFILEGWRIVSEAPYSTDNIIIVKKD